jgi:hypothetical protein
LFAASRHVRVQTDAPNLLAEHVKPHKPPAPKMPVVTVLTKGASFSMRQQGDIIVGYDHNHFRSF